MTSRIQCTRRCQSIYMYNLWWNLSDQDKCVLFSEVSSFQEWYLGWVKVSCLERCPQFRSVLLEREVPLYSQIIIHVYQGVCV